jgi:pimeloyl-ACP methyl ester carboxylesterase
VPGDGAYGERTTAMGAAVCGPVAGRLPAGRLEMLPGLTHFGPLEDPGAVAEAVARALTAV